MFLLEIFSEVEKSSFLLRSCRGLPHPGPQSLVPVSCGETHPVVGFHLGEEGEEWGRIEGGSSSQS